MTSANHQTGFSSFGFNIKQRRAREKKNLRAYLSRFFHSYAIKKNQNQTYICLCREEEEENGIEKSFTDSVDGFEEVSDFELSSKIDDGGGGGDVT